ncbi:UDP-2,3-diacylglucosamine diphosphatase [Membranihabitans marinus]|uniref:UDP-2,3-diacylglucosamine diphosphatase n=1 Tax=Membranihabitans marinus TaxID=1227546 RepID=UPI001F17633B|nr:UDP-2,3-diacylglucosamine diphosphatase [Membranihabitans marinus]
MSKIYFASDFHLGIQDSKVRETKIIQWLDDISQDASHLYLVGDLFDYWFEYNHFVPKGFIRFLGKLAALKDSGIQIDIFIGNHDVWMFDYFPEELGIPVHKAPIRVSHYGKNFLIGHGDGLGPGDHGYKRLKKIFHNPFLQFCYRQIHPDLSYRIANYWSKTSRAQEHVSPQFLGADKEWLVQYSESKSRANPDIDFFIFGHRHLPICHDLSNQHSFYFNIGDWLHHDTYGVFDGEKFYLYQYGNQRALHSKP